VQPSTPQAASATAAFGDLIPPGATERDIRRALRRARRVVALFPDARDPDGAPRRPRL
jgi:hypothetical protein